MKSKGLLISSVFFFLVLTVFSNCGKSIKEPSAKAIENLSFRNVPGITKSEIKAIEALKARYGSFTCAVNLNTDSFYDSSGKPDGFAVLFYKWLSNFFGIPFEYSFYEFGEILEDVADGKVHFTIELTQTPERREIYFMTNPFINRMVKIYRNEGSKPIADIINSRPPRYAFQKGAVLAADTAANTKYNFETIYVDGPSAAYKLLLSGEVDAYIALDSMEYAFEAYSNVTNEVFFPMIFNSSCLSTGIAELAPIISVFNKALNVYTLDWLSDLRKEGYKKFLGHKLYLQLTEDERAFLKNNPVVPFAAEFSNYPVSFFNANTNQWQGIFFDALNDISTITGITFKRVNEAGTQYPELVALLENGKALILSELLRIKEYEGRFLWSDISLFDDNYVFITRSDFHDIEIDDISDLRVGLRKNSHYSELFKELFPSHRNFKEYNTQQENWAALYRGDIDGIFASRRRLLVNTNYYEETGFKLNIIFDRYFDTSFGFNKDAAVLKSVIDKSVRLINISNISNQWMSKTYDYRIKLVMAQRPWFIGALVLFFLILMLVSALLRKSRNTGRKLESLVKQRTSDLAFQTSMLKTMIDALPDVVFCKDLEFKYTLCNNFMAESFGKKVEDILGKNNIFALGLLPEEAELTDEADLKVINERRRIVVEEWLPLANGVLRFFEMVKSPLIHDGEVIGIMGIGRDITKRKRMEDELEFKTSKLQMIVDSIPDILFCKDTDFKYTQCNKHFEDFWGISEADMLGKTDEDGDWFAKDLVSKMHNTELSVMGEEKIYTRELEILAPLTGKKGAFESVLSPLKQNGVVVGMLGIARNVTQRKEMEEEIRAALRAKTSFLANMSHEIRTPLNVIIGLTDLLMEDGSLADYVTVNLIKISNAGGTLLSIVNDILDFSKIESGKLELSPVEYYTPSLLNDVITLVVTSLGEKPVTFHLDISGDLPETLYGDDLRVKQMLTNLLTNAVKYTRQGSIELSARCTIKKDAVKGDDVLMDFTVKDTGIGIREEDLDKLFLDYFQADTMTNRNIEGTGLGLPITKRLVEMMGGTISAESEYGKGTVFRLSFKQGFVNEKPIGADIIEKLRSFCYAGDKRVLINRLVRLNLSYARVLVVDDMQTNLDVAVGFLRAYKMQIDCIDNGRDAVERIREGTPVYNAIFMDHMMPGMDGIEAAEAIRALGTQYAKNIPIIALTANAIHGSEQMFYEHGFQAFISKPIDVVEMDSVIKKWVRDASREDVPVMDTPENGEPGEINIPGINTKKGLSLCAGAANIYISLLRSYSVNTPGILDKLGTVSAETLPDYVITVHGLKGTSAGICAEAVQKAALELETMSRAGDLQGVLAKNGKFIADAQVIVANIKTWLEQHDVINNNKPRLKTPDPLLLANLRHSCENYDIKGMDRIISELESADYEKDADLIVWLRAKIETSEFDEAALRLVKYEEELKNDGRTK